MRWTKWTAMFAVTGMLGLIACGGEEGAGAAEEEPAAEAPTTEQPTAEAPAELPVPEGATAEMVAQGQQLFAGQANCFTCHGVDATGTQLAPNLTDDQWLWLDPAQGDMLSQAATLIETGVAQPKEHPAPMPPMGGAQLSPEQVQALAAYVVAIGGPR